jgi:hypothetical protein
MPVEDVDLGVYFGGTGTGGAEVGIKGPEGYGDLNMVPLDARLPYTITFANPADADEVVSEVRVMQQLDEDLDLRTFFLGDITLGPITIHLGEGRGAFTGDFDFVEELGVVVRVTAGVDVLSGTALWILTAIDPLTGLPVEDPTLGLLHPNDDHSQAGSVSYTIRPWPDTESGAAVEAQARVFIDDASPTDTDLISATVDAIAPATTTTVQSLGSGDYQVSWTT